MPIASCLVLLASCACRGFSAEFQDEPRSQVNDNPSWRDRQQALEIELKTNKLSSPDVQSKVIHIFEQETADPNWSDLAEGQEYEDYYGNLIELRQKIAETYGSPAAWHALVNATYNIDSAFGKWLTAQPQTFPLYLEMLRSGKNGRSGFAKEALAVMLARCSQPHSSHCSPVLAKRDELMRVIRSELFAEFRGNASTRSNHTEASSDMDSRQLTSTMVGSSIEALGTCGSEQDLLLLRELANKYASEVIDSNDSYELSHKESALWLIHNSEVKIKDRLLLH